jgi:SAM-dependent MidA family methyltransferase
MTERGQFEAGLRRTAPPGPLPSESEPALLDKIRAEIALSGPMTFARFMAIALYDPEHGYYRSATERPGRAGDFLTAPETHPIFGAAVARQLDEVWRRLDRPGRFVLREYGAGSGTLAATILAGLRSDGSGLVDAISYEPVEINAHRQAQIDARLGPLAQAAAGVGSPSSSGPRPARFVGAALANEFLDALPVHRVEQRDGRLWERLVEWDDASGQLREQPSQPSTPALAARLARDGVTLVEGQVAEICLEVEPWLAEVAADLERGLVVIIDYGHRAPALYDPVRTGGTLRAYAGHRAHANPFIAIGRQDLTAHVDLTALEAAARAHRLDLLGDVSQAEFLVGCGLEELVDRVRSSPATTMEEWLAIRSAVARLLDPAALGGFRVVLLGRGLEPRMRLRGLSAHPPGV